MGKRSHIFLDDTVTMKYFNLVIGEYPNELDSRGNVRNQFRRQALK